MLENGNVTCTDGTQFESRCVYFCNPGYELVESLTTHDSNETNSDETLLTNIINDTSVLTCMADKTWSGNLPSCIRKQCSRHDGALARVSAFYYLFWVCNIKMHSYQLMAIFQVIP